MLREVSHCSLWTLLLLYWFGMTYIFHTACLLNPFSWEHSCHKAMEGSWEACVHALLVINVSYHTFDFSCIVLYFSNHQDHHDGIVLMGMWIFSASSICIYIGNLLQPLEMRLSNFCSNSNWDWCQAPWASCLHKYGSRNRESKSKLSIATFLYSSPGTGSTHQHTWCVKNQQILTRSMHGCLLSQKDGETGSLVMDLNGVLIEKLAGLPGRDLSLQPLFHHILYKLCYK